MSFEYFTDEELTCKCGCGEQKMSHAFMIKIDALREKAGFPFVVSSAYRCPDHNDNVSSTGRDGPHTTGHSIDIKCSHKQAYEIVRLAMLYGFTGIGINQKGDSRFIHLDDLIESKFRPRPHIWSY